MSSKKDQEARKPASGFSRRGFLQGVGVSGGALTVLEPEALAQTPANVVSGETAITLQINGKPYKTTVEPRVTLLDAMRNQLDLTAAKRVCDRGTCGACTVIVDDKAMYSCTVLAIDAQGKQIQTLEGIAQGRNPASHRQCVRRKRRAAVRLLHAGIRGRLQGVPRQEPRIRRSSRSRKGSAAISAAAEPMSVSGKPSFEAAGQLKGGRRNG